MWRRKRSRPSSKRRLTKKLKRRSSGSSVCAKAIGVVEEQRFRTNGPPAAADGGGCPAVASDNASSASSGCGVIASPEFDQTLITSPDPRDFRVWRQGWECERRAFYCAVVAAPPSWNLRVR